MKTIAFASAFESNDRSGCGIKCMSNKVVLDKKRQHLRAAQFREDITTKSKNDRVAFAWN